MCGCINIELAITSADPWLAMAELGMGPRPPAPLIFGPNWGLEDEKKFWGDRPHPPPNPPLPKGLDDRPLSLGLNPALTGVLLLYRQCFLRVFEYTKHEHS